jgi:asparagine synthase (glutamine-hydrolysing)
MGALFGFTGPIDPKLLARQSEALAHRGRGDVQVHATTQGTLGVRGVRPSCGTFLVHDGDVAMALAGYRVGDTRTPEELLADYCKRGMDFLRNLRGAFVIAVLDRDRLVMARDGVGVRTLYWGRHEGRVLFGIEPKGVLAAPGFPRRIRPAALAQYLSMSFVPGEGTMLEGLHELHCGEWIEFADGTQRSHRFFEFEREEVDDNATDWPGRFRDAHAQAVRERLPHGEPVGIFLSGGLDSSAVTAEVAKQHDGPVHTYAIHFGPDYPNELSYARAVAERCKTKHQEVLLRPKEFLPRLRRIIWHLDDPIGDPITVPNFELAARVSRDVSFVWNGEGGDPLFGGPKNIPMMLQHWYGGIDREPGFRERAYLASYRRGYDEWPRLLSPTIEKEIDPRRDLEGVFTPFFEAEQPASFLNKLAAINIRLKGAHLILPKVDRMAGASRLTMLSPLFDEELVRLSFRMPPREKLDGGVEKLVMKRAYRELLPPEVVLRPKSGMRVPVHHWFQGELKSYARKLLSAKELDRSGIFNSKRVAKLLAYDTEEGPGRYGLRLWMLLTFEIWRRIVVENEPV